MTANPGCLSDFGERSFPMDACEVLHVSAAASGDGSTRGWLRRVHEQLATQLPAAQCTPLLTEDLTNGNGRSVDVFAHFGRDPSGLQSLLGNFRGLKYSAQTASCDYCIYKTAPTWPGFEDVWIPVPLSIDDTLALSGRLGYARNEKGAIRDADCIVVLPGIFGDHGVQRSRDICLALRDAGYHVLHLEPRGHGQTEARYPRISHTFGTVETDDMMVVHDWLVQQPHVRRTGIVGYCWTANIALLAAWYDAITHDDPFVPPPLKRFMPRRSDPDRPRFTAGVIAFSPVVRWEVLLDELDYDRSRWKHPIYAAIQDTVRDRMRLKGYPVSGSLRLLNAYESLWYHVDMPNGSRESYPFLRLIEYKGQSAGNKFDKVRMPVLIMHAADDPLVPAQDIADLMATVKSPKVGALIFPTGGHVGFGAYAPNYYLNLITNFFDPVNGAAATGR